MELLLAVLVIACAFALGWFIGWWGLIGAVVIGILSTFVEQREIEGGASRVFYGALTTLSLLPLVALGVLARRLRR